MTKREQEAKRARAGIIGALETCTCTYPIKVARNDTGHPKTCPAYHVIKSQQRARSAASTRAALCAVTGRTPHRQP